MGMEPGHWCVLRVLILLFAWNTNARPPTEELNKTVDYRYTDARTGRTKLCVFCMQRDYERHGAEKQCLDKFQQGLLPYESKMWNGQMMKFFPLCDTLQTSEYPRYVKNCSAAPEFPGVAVRCTDKDGHILQKFRVHDTCQVQCTETGRSAVSSVTVCDPVSATWTPVTCQYHSCAPLGRSLKVVENETSSCDMNVTKPVKTKCEVTCPVGYDPPVRVVECQGEGQWKLVSSCAPSPPPPTGEKSGLVRWSVGPAVATVLLVLMIICAWCFLKRRKPCGSSHSVSTEDEEETDNKEENDSLLGSSGSDSTVVKHQTNTATDDSRSPESDGSIASCPPDYTSVVSGGEYEMGKLFGADSVCFLEFYFKINDEPPEKCITESGVLLAKGTLLTVSARCKCGHDITKFNYGPFFKNNDCRLFSFGISVVVVSGDEGMYILAAQCSHGGQDMRNLRIRFTDVTGNPEHTEPKCLYSGVHLESLDGAVTQPPLVATSEPSQPLKALPGSLPSDPNLAALARNMSEVADEQQPVRERSGDSRLVNQREGVQEVSENLGAENGGDPGGATGGREGHMKKSNSTVSLLSQVSTQENHDDPPDDCTLPLIELLTDRSLKASLDKLCELLEPLSERQPDRTIQGLIYHTLGYSQDRIAHIIWAKREDLRNSPARVMLMMMMQAGKRASNVVQYFSKGQHRHVGVLQTLQRIPAHRNCPVCRKYS